MATKHGAFRVGEMVEHRLRAAARLRGVSRLFGRVERVERDCVGQPAARVRWEGGERTYELTADLRRAR